MTTILRPVGAALACLGLLAGTIAGAPGDQQRAGGEDDVGSMPDPVLSDAPSFFLVGTMAGIQATVGDVQGTGDLILWSLVPQADRFALELEGDFELQLDAGPLAAGDVTAYFGTGLSYVGGSVSLLADGTWTDAARLTPWTFHELPAGLLFEGGLAIAADGLQGQSYSLTTRTAADGGLRVVQRERGL